jgi:hypothetical protein
MDDFESKHNFHNGCDGFWDRSAKAIFNDGRRGFLLKIRLNAQSD